MKPVRSLRPLRFLRPLRLVVLGAAVILNLLIASGAQAQGAGASSAAERATSPTPITMLKLDNGLRILVLPDSATPSISVGLWIGAGWVHNPRGREGLADICTAVCE